MITLSHQNLDQTPVKSMSLLKWHLRGAPPARTSTLIQSGFAVFCLVRSKSPRNSHLNDCNKLWRRAFKQNPAKASPRNTKLPSKWKDTFFPIIFLRILQLIDFSSSFSSKRLIDALHSCIWIVRIIQSYSFITTASFLRTWTYSLFDSLWISVSIWS